MHLERFLLVCLSTLLIASSASAHEGEPHGVFPDEEGGSGPITLSEDAIRNLDIQTVPARRGTLESTVAMFGTVLPEPQRHFRVSARFNGRIKSVAAKVGERVRKDQALVVVESLQIGSAEVTLRSPVDGSVVSHSFGAVGESFTPDQPLMEIVNLDSVIIRGQLFETPDIRKIAPGQKARARIPLYPNMLFDGVIERVDAGIDPESFVFHVYAQFPNPDGRLLLNMRSTLYAVTATYSNRLIIPVGTLLGEAGQYFAFVRKGNEFSRRMVRVGRKTAIEVEVLRGIAEGEEVVSQGHYQLQFAKGAADKPALKDDHGHDHGHDHGGGHSHD